ncbi:hypothetical protein [Lysobacter sp. M15]|uniref:hypothetical protein n=1 Tax=Lysobacter sp. M15 TaxID=2916837 RepID=UPI001F5A7F6C|nr:hypothetical protein [Lysobacter sp. M15]
MKVSRRSITILVIVAITAVLAVATLPNWRWFLGADRIESQLLEETPIGSSEDQVLAHLRANGLKPAPLWRGSVEPNTIYPPNTIAGNRYTIIFTTSVEAFYVFGQDQRLVEIAVRKTTDAL